MTIGTSIWDLPVCAGTGWLGVTVSRRGAGSSLVVGAVVVAVVLAVAAAWPSVIGARLLEDRAGVRRVDRGDRSGAVVVDAVGRAVLDVRHRRVLGVGGQPLVDELLDDAAPAERGADEVAAPLRVEVAQQLLVAGVALAARAISASTSASGIVEALGLGDLAQDQQDPDALLGVGAEVGVELLVALAGDLRVGLLADPLAGEGAAELVVHDLDLLLDEDVGQVDRGVGDGVLDDPVGELRGGPCPGRSARAACLISTRSVARSAKSPIDRAKSSSASGRIFSRSSRSSTSKWASWPASDSSP